MTWSVRVTKRGMDLMLAGLGIIAGLPVMALVALAIALDSPGPILYRQRRAGRLLASTPPRSWTFEEFEMLKFRTMRTDAERHTGPVLARVDDDRVTRVGRWLRRLRLDELPQLWNVLKGEMSVVGPRPERPELMIDLARAIPYFEERMRGVRPGITGLAQVSADYAGRPRPDTPAGALHAEMSNPYRLENLGPALADDMRMKLIYDLSYVAAAERWSRFLRLELAILVRTPLAMLGGLGR